MLDFEKPLELPPQLQWKRIDEPELMSWTIRARNYNTTIANCMFGFMTILIFTLAYMGHPSAKVDGSSFSEILFSIVFFAALLFTISTMTHQKINYAYRFTVSGLEYCKWKDFPRWTLPFLRWTIAVTAVIFLFLATIDSSFLFGALAGPGGMGLMYLRMAYSKSFRELHTQYHHHQFQWKDFTQLAIATNREIVDLQYSMVLEGRDYITEWNINLHCKKRQKEEVAEFIKPYLTPGTPILIAKINVPLSTY